MASMGAGTRLHVLMPLGNGFFVRANERKVALVGGGVGIFPMISVIREYAEEKQISAYMGFRTKAAVCGLEELRKAQRLVAVTDDGSFGEKKNAVQAFETESRRPRSPSRCGARLRSSAHAPRPQRGDEEGGDSRVRFPGRADGLRHRRLPRLRVRSDERRTRAGVQDGPVFSVEDVKI